MGINLDFRPSELESPVTWDSLDNHSHLNPRIPEQDAQRLTSLLASVAGQFRGHVFLLSSGTTGKSNQDLKWVALSKAALLNSALEVNRHLKSDASDVWLHVLPEFHVGGLGIRARSYLSGAQLVSLPAWDVQEFVAQGRTRRATLASLVPAQVYDLVQNGLRCPESLRAVFVGGGALAPTLALKARDLGWPLLVTYGMTEACSQIATSSLTSTKGEGSLAPELELLPHWAARLKADGKFQIQGDSLFTAYVYSGPAGEALVCDPKEEGWFTTQDSVMIQGRKLKISGRTQDSIKVGGETVDLARLRSILENIQVEMSLVADIALITVPDERLGHVIHLISDQSLTNEAASMILEIFNRRVVAFERIRKWTRMGSLPRTSLGKLILNHESIQSSEPDRSAEVFQG